MGKIVAIGGMSIESGEGDVIIRHICSLSPAQHPKVLFLPTASFDSRDDTPAVLNAFAAYGCTGGALYLTDETLTQEQIRAAILGCDIVYVDGGNLKFLMDTWKKTAADKYFKEAFEKGTVLSGVSSGAMCWFERGYDDCGPDGRYMFVDCVGLVPGCNCPHFENGNWQSFAPAIKEENDLDGIAVENDCALNIVDGAYSVIKADPERTAWLMQKKDGFLKIDMSNL